MKNGRKRRLMGISSVFMIAIFKHWNAYDIGNKLIHIALELNVAITGRELWLNKNVSALELISNITGGAQGGGLADFGGIGDGSERSVWPR